MSDTPAEIAAQTVRETFDVMAALGRKLAASLERRDKRIRELAGLEQANKELLEALLAFHPMWDPILRYGCCTKCGNYEQCDFADLLYRLAPERCREGAATSNFGARK